MRSPRDLTDSDNVIPRNLTPEVLQALRAVRFIAQHIKDADKDNEVGTPRSPCPLQAERDECARDREGTAPACFVCAFLIVVIVYPRVSLASYYCLLLAAAKEQTAEESAASAGQRVPNVQH